MSKQTDASSFDLLASAGSLLDKPIAGSDQRDVSYDGRNLPDADLDALVEAMLGSLRKRLADNEAKAQTSY